MAALTPEATKKAFQSLIPRMRADFEARITAYRETIFRDSQYMRKYPADILRLAQEEARARHRAAEERVERLIRSGWKAPHPTAIAAVYRECFSFSDFRYDPFSDLYERVDAAYTEIGQVEPNPGDLRRRLGQAQVDAANEAISNLETLVLEEEYAPVPVVVHGTVGSIQTGSNSTATVTINLDSAGAAALADAVRELRRFLKTNAVQELPPYTDAVFADLETEVEKPTPSIARITGLLSAGASIISTTANAPAAWHAVRHAAQAIGIPLP